MNAIVRLSRTLRLLTICVGLFGASASACPVSDCTIDLNFSSMTYDGCGALANCISVRRPATKWAAWKDGHYSAFGSNVPAITDLGILIEPTANNYVRHSRDLTKRAWTKADLTATLTATGIDHQANSATTLTAIAGNATVSQSIALPDGERTLSAFIRRRSGAGPVSISYDGGKTWLPCALTTNFQRFTATSDSLASPQIVIKIATSGDAIDVDFLQLEGQRWATSPILTAEQVPGRRPADVVTVIGDALAHLNSGTFSIVVEGAGTAAGNFKRNQAQIMGSVIARFLIVPYQANVIRTHITAASTAITAILGTGPSALLSQGSMAKPFRIGASTSSSAGISLVADGGKVATSTKSYGPGGGPWYLGGENGLYSGYFTRLTVWNTKLADATLQSLTQVEIPNATVTDTGLSWKNRSVRDTATINGAAYEVQSGTLKDSTSNTNPSQIGPYGNLIRFNMFANNQWAHDDIKSSGGSERTEFAGYSAGSRARFDGNTVESIWGSDSFYIEKGDPVTTNWCAFGQMHVRFGPPAVAFSFQNGEFLAVDIQTEGGVSQRIARYPMARGAWYHRVFNIRFNQSGKGFVKVWINGVQIADYVGNTGNSKTPLYYWKFGIYRSQAPEHIAVRYANPMIGTTDLSAKIAKPDSIPQGYCTDTGAC